MAKTGWDTGDLLGFDLETTGVRRHGDVPVSFALVEMRRGRVTWRCTRLVDPGRAIPEAATAVHGITTERARREGMPLARAVAMLADALVSAGRRGVPVVGMNLAYDLSMLDHQLRRLAGTGLREAGWEGPVLDVLVLDRHLDRYRPGTRRLAQLCAHYAIDLAHAHEAASDAEAALSVLLALCERFPSLLELDPALLTERQTAWHTDWADGFDAWLRARGRDGLAASERSWPLAPAAGIPAAAQPVPAPA